MLKALSFAALVALAASQASAASNYYVAHANSKSCSVTEMRRPDGKTMIHVGRPHNSKSSAGIAMKSPAGCAR